MVNPTYSPKSPHFSVMLDEVINLSKPEKGGVFVDCTFGGGGFSKKILKFSNTKVIALDIYKQQKSEKLNEDFDFIFIDPPFKDKQFSDLLVNLKKNKIIKKKTVLIIHRHKNSADNISSEINILKENIYGKSKIIFGCLY